MEGGGGLGFIKQIIFVESPQTQQHLLPFPKKMPFFLFKTKFVFCHLLDGVIVL